MTTIIDGLAWIPFLQIQIAATGVIVCAAFLARFVEFRRIMAREWLWHGALVGVLASTLVPLLNRASPMAGVELAILPNAVPVSEPATAGKETEFVALPIAVPQAPPPYDNSRKKNPEAQSVTPPTLSMQPEMIVSFASLPAPSRKDVSARTVRQDNPARDTTWDWILGTLFLCWFAGILYHFMRGLIGMLICRRIVEAAIPLDHAEFDDVLSRLKNVLPQRASLRISASSNVGSPAVIGTFRPHIVLPVSALQWMSSAQLFQVLLHESAHVIRRDPLVKFLQVIARALFWHHPLVHWLNRRLSQSREDVCDNFVLAHSNPADYAETLLVITEKCPRLLSARGLAMLSDSGSLEERVTGLLDETRDRSIRWPLWRKLGMVSGLLLVTLFMGLIRVTERSIQADEPKKSRVEEKLATPATTTAKSTESAETSSCRISGQVLFEKDRQAAAKTTVVLLPPPPKGQDVYIGLLPLRETTVDSEGRFSFESLDPGKYHVWANLGKQTSRKHARKGTVVMLENGGEPPKPVELRLVDGVTVSAKVTDKATGKLIPNATIRLGWSDLVGDFHSDGSTPAIVQPLTAERWFFEAWADGYAKESRWLNLENGNDVDTEFQVVPGGNLDGIVRNPQGKPVEGVGVSVSFEGNHTQVAWVQTDSQGHYQLDHLPFGRGLNLYLSKVDWVSQEISMRLTDAKQKRDVTVAERPHGGTITGVVQDGRGRPIADAVLQNMGTSSQEIRETTSDLKGRFKLDNVYRGSTGHEVMVRAPKFAPQRLKFEPGPAGKPNKITIKMEPGHRIAGRVTDQAGNVIEGVTVYFANGNVAFSIGGNGTTDKDGKFEFDSLPADCPFTFHKPGYSSVENQKLMLDMDDFVTVNMIPVGTILGRVTDRATGKAIRSFNVRLNFSPRRTPHDPISGLRGDWVKPGQTFQSDAGKFKLGELVAGMPLQVMIDADGYETCVQERVDAARSDEAEDVLFELDRIDPATLRKYSGQLLDANGTPVNGAQLRLIVARDRMSTKRASFPFNWQMIRTGQLAQQAQILRFLEGATDIGGRFEFTGVPRNAEVELVWWGGDISSGRADHLELLEEEAIEITLLAAARITGKLDRKKFPEIGRVDVAPDDQALESIGLELKPDQQEFEIGNLAPGKYTVSIMSPFVRIPGSNDGEMTNRRLASTTIILEEGTIKQVDLTIENPNPNERNPPKTTPLK